MKGKLNLRFFAPNVAKVRTRMKEVPADFTPTLRAVLAEAAAEVIEKNQVEFKAAVITRMAEAYPDVEYTSTTNKNAVESVMQDFYSIFVTATKEEFDQRFGIQSDEPTEVDEDQPEEVPAETAQTKKPRAFKAATPADDFED